MTLKGDGAAGEHFSPQNLGFASVVAALHKAFQSKTSVPQKPGESRSPQAAKIWHI